MPRRRAAACRAPTNKSSKLLQNLSCQDDYSNFFLKNFLYFQNISYFCNAICPYG